jgi:hypothetical protein
MPRRIRLSPRARQDLLEAADGICHLCKQPIVPGERWEVSHPIPLGIGGRDDSSNRAPAHTPCHRYQTRRFDVPRIAKAVRQRQKHIGASRPGLTFRALPGGRDDPRRKKLNGKVVSRQTGEDWR